MLTLTALNRTAINFLCAPRAICMGCGSLMGSDQNWLCAKCAAQLRPINECMYLCPLCGTAFPRGVCPQCRTAPNDFIAVAAYEYTDTMRSMITRFKFHGTYRLDKWMAGQMHTALTHNRIQAYSLIVPVPMHWLRRMDRGYNQSERLARRLSELTGKPFGNVLKRIKNTPQQSKLSADRRRTNLSGAIVCAAALHGETVLLVDDVRTTGTTALRCAEALKKSGAGRIILITLARAGRKN